ncbi:pectate lyase-like isoform X1 [Tasmannia lanceolata]|uniref:pectate lyase-like isoform X1 n=2 Tax=Tasmannia lanceolata TaxID=3420 RepID=UPI0040630D8B
MEAMKSRINLFSLLFFLVFSAVLVPSRAKIVDFDEEWQKRADEARAVALTAYHPTPEDVSDHLNSEVHGATESNKTRRHLGKYRGPCMATNPIDQCWRCNRNWARNRKRLADCALGFGRNTIGGKYGKFYVVTNPSDADLVNPKVGTLRHAVIQTEPLWIIFGSDMIIRLQQELMVNSHKTIDGRGHQVRIANGAGITIQYVRNVIIHGLHIHDIKAGQGGMIRDSPTHFGFRGASDGDGIGLFGSANVWIDHVSMSNCYDGLIDIIEGSTAITLSNNHFTHHNEVMLMGASDKNQNDSIMQVTLAFNHFGKGLTQRMPRCRWGFFHVVNNDYTHWEMYAIGGSQHPTIISQGNRYIATPHGNTEVTKRDYAPDSVWMKWTWRSEGDLFMNGAIFRQSGAPNWRRFSRRGLFAAKPGTFASRLTRFAGALRCSRKMPC